MVAVVVSRRWIPYALSLALSFFCASVRADDTPEETAKKILTLVVVDGNREEARKVLVGISGDDAFYKVLELVRGKLGGDDAKWFSSEVLPIVNFRLYQALGELVRRKEWAGLVEIERSVKEKGNASLYLSYLSKLYQSAEGSSELFPGRDLQAEIRSFAAGRIAQETDPETVKSWFYHFGPLQAKSDPEIMLAGYRRLGALAVQLGDKYKFSDQDFRAQLSHLWEAAPDSMKQQIIREARAPWVMGQLGDFFRRDSRARGSEIAAFIRHALNPDVFDAEARKNSRYHLDWIIKSYTLSDLPGGQGDEVLRAYVDAHLTLLASPKVKGEERDEVLWRLTSGLAQTEIDPAELKGAIEYMLKRLAARPDLVTGEELKTLTARFARSYESMVVDRRDLGPSGVRALLDRAETVALDPSARAAFGKEDCPYKKVATPPGRRVSRR